MIKEAQTIRAGVDFGPVKSLTGLPAIKSKVQTNIAPATPNKMSTIPFVFIDRLPLNRALSVVKILSFFQLLINKNL